MSWPFYVIVGGSILLALVVSWLGKREERKEQAAGEQA